MKEEEEEKGEEAGARGGGLDRQVQADLPPSPAESCAWRKWAGHFPHDDEEEQEEEE